MTENDLGLKVGVRSLLWAMGFSTRLDVQLRGESGFTGSRKVAESFTDLDVLGVLVAPGHRLTSLIADCKTGKSDKPTARMFWARGVADFFGAEQVMLVREREVNDATRQLSSRLGISVLTTADLLALEKLHGPPLSDLSGPLSVLFDKVAVADALAAYTGLDRRLRPLLEYREFDFWLYDPKDNPIQMVAHLREAAERLDSRNPIHLALLLDLAWLYLTCLVRLVSHLRAAFLRDADRGLQEYLLGGATGVREKQYIAAMFERIKPEGSAPLDHLPDYYANLRELVTRLMRRPHEIQGALRYAEAASALMAARQKVTLTNAFGREYDPITAKLVADVCGFLIAAGQLDPGFRVQARAYLLAEPVAMTAIESKDSAEPT